MYSGIIVTVVQESVIPVLSAPIPVYLWLHAIIEAKKLPKIFKKKQTNPPCHFLNNSLSWGVTQILLTNFFFFDQLDAAFKRDW